MTSLHRSKRGAAMSDQQAIDVAKKRQKRAGSRELVVLPPMQHTTDENGCYSYSRARIDLANYLATLTREQRQEFDRQGAEINEAIKRAVEIAADFSCEFITKGHDTGDSPR